MMMSMNKNRFWRGLKKGLMWSFMLNANFGVLAQFLKAIGHSEWIINWLATPTVNIWCVVLVNEWMYLSLIHI